MSMADNDSLDFSFDTVSKGKKKTSNFEKLDMNFNLDGELDKISSFIVDMSDLDFTCPPKKSSQSMDKKEESSSAKAGKQDGFDFSFDFKELDGFNLDSSLKGNTNSNSNLRKKGVSKEGSADEGPKKPKTTDDGSVHTSNDSMAMKPAISEKLETSRVDTLVGNLENLASRQYESVSKFSASGNVDMPVEKQISDISKTVRTTEMDQERNFLDKTKPTESKPEQFINKAPSYQSVGQSDSEQETIPGQQMNVFSSGTKVINVSGDKQQVNDKATNVDSDNLDLQSEHSSQLHITKSNSNVGEAINFGSSTQEEVTNDTHSQNTEDITKTDALKKISRDNDVRENKNSNLGCHLAKESSRPVVDKIMLMKDKELRGMQPNMFMRAEEKNTSKQPSSTAGAKGISYGCKINSDMHLRSITQARESHRSNETRIGSNLVSDSPPGSSKLTRDGPVLPSSKDDLKSCSNSRESIVSDVMPSGNKLAGNMGLSCEEENKSKGILLETDMPTEDVDMLSSQVNPSSLTEKAARNAPQVSVNSQAEVLGKESSEKSRITSIEKNQLSSFKAGKINPAFSSLKTLRNIGSNRILLISLHQKEANSLVRSERSAEIQSTTSPKNDHLTVSCDNQQPSIPFLKRKIIEVREADLTTLRPLKRLSQSPSNSRNSKESSEVEQVESKHNNVLCSQPTFGLESPSEIKVTDVEIPDSILMEDKSNVEKAEAYMKELEDICNMLKKKHEEAKELLVRAIVNDNNLLMLNHPVYEEEIRLVQKFASELMSTGIQT